MPRTVADLMQKKVLTIAPGKSLPELERALLRSRVGAMPVIDRSGRMVGIVSRSDVVRQLCLERSLGEAMADAYRDQTDEAFVEKSRRDVVTVEPDCPLPKAAQLMVERRIHRLPVVQDGKLVGIVSSLDFTRLVAEAPA